RRMLFFSSSGFKIFSLKLRRKLLKKRMSKLITVNFCNVRIPALASWRSFIEALIGSAEDLEVLHSGVAAELSNGCVWQPGKSHPESHSAGSHPKSDGGALALTTNYDDLLELYRQKPMESLDLNDQQRLQQWARGHNTYGVLHIHVMEASQQLYKTKPLIFLGCGKTLSDQVLHALILQRVQKKGAPEHYMLEEAEKQTPLENSFSLSIEDTFCYSVIDLLSEVYP
uniref:SIR2-like domain-containing protein n=1 Tax=Leptobrachium leishanense TaxID=445787 RepID=A0A8C5MM67_9ANUR